MAKKLIINADDFGVSEDINTGIMECYACGAVSDISLLAGGDAFGHAVELAKRHGVRALGVHLALSGSFRPVGADGASSLAGARGLLPDHYGGLFIKLLTGTSGEREIYGELRAQIAKIRAAGFGISHVDSHEHVHLFPSVLRVVLRLLREEHVPFVRFPRENISWKLRLAEPSDGARTMLLSSMCRISERFLRSAGALYADNFAGQFHAQRLSRQDLFTLVAGLPHGLTELCCHPGYFGRSISRERPWYRFCEREKDVLCSQEFRSALREHTVEVVSFDSVIPHEHAGTYCS